MKEVRPWGSFSVEASGRDFKVKTLVIKPGEQISLQRHGLRDEWWCIIQGRALVTKDSDMFYLEKEDNIKINRGQVHRVLNYGHIQDLIIREFQYGTCKEDDIERLKDDYGRI